MTSVRLPAPVGNLPGRAGHRPTRSWSGRIWPASPRVVKLCESYNATASQFVLRRVGEVLRSITRAFCHVLYGTDEGRAGVRRTTAPLPGASRRSCWMMPDSRSSVEVAGRWPCAHARGNHEWE